MEPSPESIPMARTLGFWLAGFAIPMLAGWFLLRRARAPGRRPATAVLLRIAAVLAAMFLVHAGYVGSGGRLNLGGMLAIVVVVLWAIREQLRKRGA